MFEKIKNWFGWSRTFGAARSPQWSKIRNAYLVENPACAVCGRTNRLNVHHIVPFSRNPSLELTPSNLITLCDGLLTRNDHLYMGHLGSFRSFNLDIRSDALYWRDKIETRP